MNFCQRFYNLIELQKLHLVSMTFENSDEMGVVEWLSVSLTGELFQFRNEHVM